MLQPVLEALKIRSTRFRQSDHLAVQNRLSQAQRSQRLGNGRKLVCPIIAAPRYQTDFIPVDERQQAIAVEFELMQPVVATRRFGDERGKLRRKLPWHRSAPSAF